MADAQEKTNEFMQAQINELKEHARISNHEVGAIKIDIGIMRNDLASLKERAEIGEKYAEKLDSRTFWILGTVIFAVVVLGINVIINLLK